MKLDIETWTSDKGNSEVHHFVAGTQTYVFGVNKELLGDEFSSWLLEAIQKYLRIQKP